MTTATPGISQRLASPFHRKYSGRRYLCILLLVPVLAYLCPLVLEKIPFLNKAVSTDWGEILDHGYNLQNEDADVVIFGDSAATFDVDTVQLSRDLGLKVITLPGTMGSLPVTGTMALDSYLAHNKAPALILFYFAAQDLDAWRTESSHSEEGIEQVIRHGTLTQLWHTAKLHPEDFFLFPVRYYTLLLPTIKTHLVHPMVVTQGHAEYPNRRALGHTCVLPPSMVDRVPSQQPVADLLHRYATSQTKTQAYLAPLPACDGADALLSRDYNIIAARPPSILQPEYFSSDGYYAHLLPEGAGVATRRLADALIATGKLQPAGH